MVDADGVCLKTAYIYTHLYRLAASCISTCPLLLNHQQEEEPEQIGVSCGVELESVS